jgi:DHA1 family arabinose polymer transporter-like MFS transporter
MTFITGAIAFAVISPMQMLMIRAAKGSEMLASSAIQASSNMGNALGAYLGGLPIAAGYGYTAPQYIGAGLALTGSLFALLLGWRNRQAIARSITSLSPAINTGVTRIRFKKVKTSRLEEPVQ